MQKILITLFVSLLTVGAFACDGNGKGKEKQEDKRAEVSLGQFNLDRR